MICLVQRVTRASVTIGSRLHASIGNGLLIFLGIANADTVKDVDLIAEKLCVLRIMKDGQGKMNKSITDTGGEIMVISQFTLCANLTGGRRPDFFPAMEPSGAKKLYERFIARLTENNIAVKAGEFGAHMDVELVNDGPVTFILDSTKLTSS